MKKSGLILIVMFLLSIYTISANTNYNETGNFDSFYQLGLGLFNDVEIQTSADYDTSVRAITGKQTPIITDLDGDGTNEIIALDDDTFRLYQDKELTIIDSHTLTASGRYSNYITYDIDADGFMEIIIALEQIDELHILEYNGTVFQQQNLINLSGLTHAVGTNAGEMSLKCRASERCLLVYADNFTSLDTSPTDRHIYGVGFNSTSLGAEALLETSDSFGSAYCFPKIRTIAVADYDGDNDDEFIFVVAEMENGGHDDLQILWVNLADDLTVTVEESIENTDTPEVTAGANTCLDSNVGKAFTPVTVFDIDGSPSNGLETVLGLMVDSDEYIMQSYDGCSTPDCGTITKLDEYPEQPLLGEADGVLISNVIRASVFTADDAETAFCVMGYDDTGGVIDLLCASEQETYTSLLIPYQSVEFQLDVSALYNVTQSYANWNVITHSAQHSTETTDGVNLHEVVNSYGVSQLNWDDTFKVEVPPVRTLDLIFENPKADAVVISCDVEKIGREDLLVQTNTNLWYIDDKYTNSDGYISEYYVDPCLDATWKINTSLEVRITVNNVDSEEDSTDTVSARVILYQGDTNEQDTGWSNNVTAGTTITFADLKINSTISTGTLRLMGRDTVNPSNTDIIDLTFSVGLSGVEFGDCSTEVDVEAPEEEIELPATCDEDDDCPSGYFCVDSECIAREETGVVQSVGIIGGLMGLSSTIIWIIFMIAIALGVWFYGGIAESHPSVALGVILIVEILMLILGTLLGFLPIGIIITIVLVGIIILGLWLGRKLTGVRTNGGFG